MSLNSVDFPDDQQISQSGTGVLFYNTSTPAGVYGPYSVVNMPAVTVLANFQYGAASSLSVIFSNSPTNPPVAPTWTEQYSCGQPSILYDEIKVMAPYMFLDVFQNLTGLQVATSLGGRGQPANNRSSIILAATGQYIDNLTPYSQIATTMIPGPATAVAWAPDLVQPVMVIQDCPNGVPGACLGWAEAPTALGIAAGGSGVTLPFVCGNNPIRVKVFTASARSESDCTISVMSNRGF